MFLDGINSGDILNVVANLNGGNGFLVNTFNGGTISGNTASGNSSDGFEVLVFNGGNTAVFSNNSSTSNTLLGYNILSGTPFSGVGTNVGFGNGGGTEGRLIVISSTITLQI